MALFKNPFMRKSFFRSMQLMQVFEGAPGHMVCRFFIASPTPDMGKHLTFKTLDGQPIQTEPVVLDAFYDNRGLKTYGYSVISASLPKMKPFTVSNRGKEELRVTQDMLDQKAHERDCMMVNPSIDPWYVKWMDQIEPKAGYSKEWLGHLSERPLFSIVTPIFNTPDSFLRDMIESVISQTYESWELILVNASPDNSHMKDVLSGYVDARINVIELEDNISIASNTNVGIKAAKGDFICFLDHDDTLAPDILAEYARVANEDSQVDLIYCDEDSLSEGGTERFDPRFKPELNIGLLYAVNYIIHFLCVSRNVIESVELTPSSLSGSQDYDLTIKAVEVARSAHRVPVIGYHWRCHEGSSNGGRMGCAKPYIVEAGINALTDHFNRIGVNASVDTSRYLGAHVIKPRFDSAETDAAIVAIPGKAATLNSLVESLQECSMREEMTIYYVDSKTQPIAAIDADVRAVAADKNASFAKRVNSGVRSANGEVVILASTDIKFTAKDDLRLLLGAALMPNIGAVAPKAMFADDLIQHAGLCIHEDGSIGYLNQNFTADMGGGYLSTAEFVCDFSALDPQCLAFRKSVFEEVGGFDEQFQNPVVAGVDFCFKLRAAGYRVMGLPSVVVTSFAPFFDNWRRKGFAKGEDIDKLWAKWSEGYRRDVLFNPNVDMNESYFHLNVKGIK